MLEEALNDDKKNPAEVALALLSYVQLELPAGGTAAESRFYRLYEPLCDRIFGPLIDEANKGHYRHKDSGWLSEKSPWNMSQSFSRRQGSGSTAVVLPHSSSSASKQSNTSLESDPVVKFLGTAGTPSPASDPLPPTLIEAISAESINRPGWGFGFPFGALPVSLRESWLATLESSSGSHEHRLTDNSRKLLTQVLRRGPLEQKDLIKLRHQSTQNTEQISMMKLSPRGFHSPVAVGAQANIPQSQAKKQDEEAQGGKSQSPKIILSMLEHFFFLYFHFPLAKPKPSKVPAPQGFVSASLAPYQKQPFGDTVYNLLFRRYLRHFLPYEKEGSRHIGLPPDNRESELFLRILIAMWIETQGHVKTTHAVMEAIHDRHRRSGLIDAPSLGLNSAYDLVVARYEPPMAQVQQCLRSTIIHIILDPALNKSAVGENGWFPTKAMDALTQPFFNCIRTTFRHASIHQQDTSPFFWALDAWLVWLEPWNVDKTQGREFSRAAQRMIGHVSSRQRPQRSTLIIPRQNHTSRYTSEWEPFIAANVHMYATPLAIFLRRSRELDFSSHKHQTSMKVIRRVFRVFTPQVVDAVSRHLSGTSNLPHLVQHHCDVLGSYAPPTGTQMLSSCQPDMKALLEEIHIQHVKKVREMDIVEWVESYIDSLFRFGVASGEEKALTKVVERAKAIVQLPISYSPMAAPPPSTPTSPKMKQPVHLEDGTLTDLGFQQVVTGATKIDPASVGYVGDKAGARLGSHEILLFVELATIASDYVHQKTGFRVHFRILADYRNVLAILVPLVLWRMLQ